MEVYLILRDFILCYGHIWRGTEEDWQSAVDDCEENHDEQSKIMPPASLEEETDTRQHLNVVFIGHVGIKSLTPSLFLCLFCNATEILLKNLRFAATRECCTLCLQEFIQRFPIVKDSEKASAGKENRGDTVLFWYCIVCITKMGCNIDRDVAVDYRCREVHYWRSDPLFDKYGGWTNYSEIWTRIQGEESGKLVSLILLR